MADRGRPALPHSKKRSEAVRAKLTPSEARRWRALAEQLGQPPATLAREAMLQFLEEQAGVRS